MTRTTTVLSLFGALIGTLFSSGVANAQAHCNGVTGHYGNVTAVVVGQDGKSVTITMANDRPPAYGLCTPDGKLNINFSAPDENLQGQFDGKAIKWSNNSVWTKAPMCWVGVAGKPACK